MQDGTVLRNRYRIERLIGRGGMAEVYLVFDLRRQVHVAVKVLREDLAEDPEFVRRFEREAGALARLEHPNVVRFYTFEREGPLAFIVMDYIPGTTLRRRIMEVGGPLPLEEVSKAVRQVGAALQFAHNEGYIHRDIKPGNVMLRADGTALLSDFGIARVAEGATMTVGPVGTPAYMSPEQILGQEVDPRTDIYSFGVVLYEALTGRRPFTGDVGTGTTTIERIRDEHLRHPPPDPRRFNRHLPAAAAEVILRCLAKRSEERWPDLVSLLQAWDEATGGAPKAAPTAAAIPIMSRPATAAARSPQPLPAIEPARVAVPTAPEIRRVVAPPAGKGVPWSLVGAIGGVAILLLGLIVALIVISGGAAARNRNDRGVPTTESVPTVLPSLTAVPAIVRPPSTVAEPTLTAMPPTATAVRPTATTEPATQVPSPSPQPFTATPVPPTASATAPPTETPVPPTATPVPPSATPVPSSPTQPPTTVPTRQLAAPVVASYPAPILVSPADRANASGQTTFSWSWDGPALAANQAFEIRIWQEGQPDHYGAAEPVRTTSVTIDVRTAYGVTQGGSGTYYWTVALVERDPYKRIGPEASPRTLAVSVGASRPQPTLAPP